MWKSVWKYLCMQYSYSSMLLFKTMGHHVLTSQHTIDMLIAPLLMINRGHRYIISNMNEGLLMGAVYLDLKKAFDTVNYLNVLKNMSSLSIKDTKHLWFKDYLDNRKQCIWINNTSSEYLHVHCGVPLGIPKIVFYADDTILLFASNYTNKIKGELEQDVTSATKKLSLHNVNLNINKTKWALFASCQCLRRSNQPEISINDENLANLNESNISVCISMLRMCEPNAPFRAKQRTFQNIDLEWSRVWNATSLNSFKSPFSAFIAKY